MNRIPLLCRHPATVASLVVLSLAAACSSSDAPVTPVATPDAGGADAGTCDPAKEPKDSAGCLTNAQGIFVDGAKGDDAAPGTREQPARTITGGLAKLAGRMHVFVCGAGPYAESLRLDARASASIHAGFDCADWSYNGKRAAVTPSAPGFVVAVNGVASDVVLSDIDFAVLDDSAPGASSIAIFGYASSRVTLRRATVRTGNGIDGADAIDAPAFSPVRAPPGASGASGGAATPNPQCPASIGGAGGANGAAGQDGAVAITPIFPANHYGRGGANTGSRCTDIGAGSYGTAGTGGAGAATAGTFDGSGWKGTDGEAGAAGGNGQGGGGGQSVASGYNGGAGSPGGCGGRGGDAGKAGGSSIGILALQTTFALEESQITVGNAGHGGHGGKGQTGQLADVGGTAKGDFQHACDGNGGGLGGSGGGGGGGSGGMSLGILYAGAAPLVDGALTGFAQNAPSISLGSAGTGGGAGAGGGGASDPRFDPDGRAGLAGTAGVDGQAKAVLELP